MLNIILGTAMKNFLSVPQIIFEYPNIQPNNAILDELESFATAILENKPIEVSLQDGTEALKVALEIMEMIKN